MIKQDFYMIRSDGQKLVISYSDNYLFLQNKNTGALYDYAIDLAESVHEYLEVLGTEIAEENRLIIIDPEEEVELSNDAIAEMLEEVM